MTRQADWTFPPPPQPFLSLRDSAERFPVRRIYCVGRNYRAHAEEMGHDPDREAPFFFSKPADAIVANGEELPYPPRCADFHHEVELVAAIGRDGKDISPAQAAGFVFGYAVGVDLTRRDLQAAAKARAQPWDCAKGFDCSAPVSALTPAGALPDPLAGRIALWVNGELRQQADLSELIWSVPEIIAELSTFFTLRAGDLIFTGTPSGVSALHPGDQVEAHIEGIEALRFSIRSASPSR